MKDFAVVVIDRDFALMNALKAQYFDVFNLLCIWHINKNVLKNCKSSFRTQKDWKEFLIYWYRVVYAHTRIEYNAAYKEFVRKFRDEHIKDVQYVKNIWVTSWRSRFCRYKINEIFHFNTLIISRVEGGHRVLKHMLKFSTGDFMVVVDRLETLISNQMEDYEHRLDQVKSKTAMNLSRDLMRNLIGRVSFYALQKIQKQYRLVRKVEKQSKKHSLQSCSHAFIKTMGLSCAHIIQIIIQASGKLFLEDVHSHWRFKKPVSSLTFSLDDFTFDPIDAFVVPSTTSMSFYQSMHIEQMFDDDFSEFDDILHGRSNRISSLASFFDSDSVFEVGDFLDVNESKKVKPKGRFRGSQNKKGTMTRAEKKVVKFTKRDASGFEIVEQAMETRYKRAKVATRGGGITAGRGSRGGERGGRGGRGGGGRGGRGGGTIAVKSKAIDHSIEVSSDSEEDEESDDGFGNLESSDEEFDDGKHGDKEDKDDWMY